MESRLGKMLPEVVGQKCYVRTGFPVIGFLHPCNQTNLINPDLINRVKQLPETLGKAGEKESTCLVVRS